MAAIVPGPGAALCGVRAAATLLKVKEHMGGPSHAHFSCALYIVLAGGDAVEVGLIPLSGAFEC